MDVLGLMREYNKLLKRWKDAENYQKDDSVLIADKVRHIPKLEQLHDEIVAKALEINKCGYNMSRDEYEQGFRQIQFLDK